MVGQNSEHHTNRYIVESNTTHRAIKEAKMITRTKHVMSLVNKTVKTLRRGHQNNAGISTNRWLVYSNRPPIKDRTLQ